ncbi:hypothetical protein K7432_009359 [Basidiobolus ranarum]|uniref:Late embryogenesis abundant protein LEA-2 subgroup domain-containing protein n=1 Tax=Basidiobolus ranarum TaxID=34480 RepID=A0ABR2WQE1_9FUNG
MMKSFKKDTGRSYDWDSEIKVNKEHIVFGLDSNKATPISVETNKGFKNKLTKFFTLKVILVIAVLGLIVLASSLAGFFYWPRTPHGDISWKTEGNLANWKVEPNKSPALELPMTLSATIFNPNYFSILSDKILIQTTVGSSSHVFKFTYGERFTFSPQQNVAKTFQFPWLLDLSGGSSEIIGQIIRDCKENGSITVNTSSTLTLAILYRKYDLTSAPLTQTIRCVSITSRIDEAIKNTDNITVSI